MVSGRNGREENWERPALSGELGANYEEPVTGGGSEPKEFIPPSEVREVFSRGIARLNERIARATREHRVEATMARVRLRPDAIAKSHRHSTVFGRRRFQVAGVRQPGDILALVTKRSITGLSELVDRATQRQLAHLSAVAEVTPYEAKVERGPQRSVMTLFDGILDDGSSLRSHGFNALQNRGIDLKPYGKLSGTYTTTSLPPNESLRGMPWVRGIRPVIQFRLTARLGAYPLRPMTVLSRSGPLPLPIVGVIDSGIDNSNPVLQRLIVVHESHVPATHANKTHGSLVGALAATGGGFTQDSNYFPPLHARLADIQVLGSGI